ncbi:MAG: 50S ribosomal protein L18e [Nanoarchaeota archaeon]|nr:50S ribosomal protein L18e [Nanoarchaeota archaeon]
MVKKNIKIEKQLKRKTNSDLVKTIITAKKNKKWKKVAERLSSPKRKSLNLEEINKQAKEGEIIVIPGKVLSQGEIDKKIKIVAFNFSEKAKEKLLKSSVKVLSILEEIKKNPEAKGVKFLE